MMLDDVIKDWYKAEFKPELEKMANEELAIIVPKIINKILDDMEFSDQGYSEPSCIRRCSAGERMTCKREIRREVILELRRKGYLNEGKVFGLDFWSGELEVGNFKIQIGSKNPNNSVSKLRR